MRLLLLALFVALLPGSAFAQIGAPDATAPDTTLPDTTLPETTLPDTTSPDTTSTTPPDPRVRAALNAEGWNYQVDGDGDYKLVVSFSNEDRSQIVWVRSVTLQVDDVEIREIWSPVYANGNASSVPPDVAQWAIEASWNLTLGSLAADGNGTVYVVTKIDADAPSSTLSSVIRVTASTGDELEKVYSARDDL